VNIHNYVYYIPYDLVDYFKYKRYNECPAYGYIKVFNGYFGSGKSLSAVQEVIEMYKKYNGLEVYNDAMGVFLKQQVTIISNLKLFGVPYIPFVSEQQFIDYEVAPSEVVIFLVDEIGTVWNNRNFKEFNPDVFNNIVQSRKRRISIYGTLPVFAGTDINVRRYTNTVVFCEKGYRHVKQSYFDAVDVDNCNNINMLQPRKLKYLFIHNKYYQQYDTRELVDKLLVDMKEGNLLTFQELNIEDGKSDMKLARLKKKYRKRQK
jgi:hypothetical protein